MTIKDKYNIPTATWLALLRDGVIPCSVARQDEILTHFRSLKNSGVSHSEAVNRTAIDLNVSEKWVYETIRKYK